MGPKTVPCGTPELTVIDEEETPSRTTCCVLIVKKIWIQLCSFPVIPNDRVLKEVSDEVQGQRLC